MPITIQHGVPASSGLPGLAQTAMQIQAQKEAAAFAAITRGGGGGGSRGGGGGRGGGSSAAELMQREAYNQESARRQEFELEAQQAEYEQRLKEQGFKYEYTETARQELAQINNSRQRVKTNENFSTKEQATMLRELDFKELGIEKSAIPAEKEKFSEGKRIGDVWKDEDGNLMRRNADGRPDVLVDYKDTKPGIKAQQDYDRQKAEDKWIADLSTEEIDDGVGGKRFRGPNEVAKTILAAENAKEKLKEIRAKRQQQQELIESGVPNWVQQRISEGIDIQSMDIDLGPVMGPIHAIARQLANKPDRTPSEEADLQALTLRLREYSPESGIEEFAVQERQGLKKKSRSRFSGSSAGMTYGVF